MCNYHLLMAVQFLLLWLPIGTLPNHRIVLWGFDSIRLGSVVAGSLDTRAIDLRGTVKNMISMSTACNTLVFSGRDAKTRRPAIYTLRMPLGVPEISIQKEVYQAAIGPACERIAYTTYGGTGKQGDLADITIVDLKGQRPDVVIRGRGSPGTTLSWNADGKQLAFDTQRISSESRDGETNTVTRKYQSWVESLDVEKGLVSRLFEGDAPTWAPDGNRLAYRRGDSVFIRDVTRRNDAKLSKRHKLKFVGAMYWSAGGDYLAANARAGLMDDKLQCVLINTSSGEVSSLGTSSYWCGPWLEAPDGPPSR